MRNNRSNKKARLKNILKNKTKKVLILEHSFNYSQEDFSYYIALVEKNLIITGFDIKNIFLHNDGEKNSVRVIYPIIHEEIDFNTFMRKIKIDNIL